MAAAAASSVSKLALDCEGVELGRHGTIEIVSLVFHVAPKDTFLLDVGESGNSTFREERISALKRLLESSNVIKIIHDCKKDSDALYHYSKIKLCKVHDTSVFHHAIARHEEDKSLNYVLSYNGLAENEIRDKSVHCTERIPDFGQRVHFLRK
jgi:DNA polymerase I-like protein with 3'-5' exonuclease and polymerase domains